MKFYFKKWLNKSLKGLHNFFFKIGINISLIKKTNNVSAFKHNSLEEQNRYYASIDSKNYSKAYQQFFEKISSHLEENKISFDNKIIADFGCGIGNFLFYISNKYSPMALFGFDFSDKAIEFAQKQKSNITFKQHNIYQKTDIQFDIILCTEVLEHISYPEKALQNLISVLNDNGCLFITIPDGRMDNYEGHINFWSPESWKIFVENNCMDYLIFETGYLSENCLYALIRKGN